MRRLFIVLALLSLIAATLACGSDATEAPSVSSPTPEEAVEEEVVAEEPTEESAEEEVPAEDPTEEPTEEPEVTPTLPPLGHTVEQFGVSFSASAVEDPSVPGMLYQEEEGMRLIGVEVIVGAVGDEPVSVNPLYVSLVDEEGFTYEVELGALERGQIDTTDIGPGEKVRGWVGFKIPEDAVPMAVRYEAEIFSGDYIRVGLQE